jgi:hypothetical protein
MLERGQGFHTSDLSDLEDKRLFDALTTKAKIYLKKLPERRVEEVRQFEALLGLHEVRTTNGSDADQCFPMLSRSTLPKKYQKEPDHDPRRPELIAAMKNRERQIADADSASLSSGCYAVVCLFFAFLICVANAVPDTVTRVLGFMIGIFLAGFSLLVLLAPHMKRRLMTNQLNVMQGKHEALLRDYLQKWQWEKEDAADELKKENEEIVLENARRKVKRREAANQFNESSREIGQLINRRIDDHPDLQMFVTKV